MNNPTPAQIKQARKEAGLTQTKAAETIYYKMRAWQEWEAGKCKMHPSAYELFLLKTNQATPR